MPRYLVKSPLDHDGKPYAIGDSVTLTEEQAVVMPWAVEAVPAPAPRAARNDEDKPGSKAGK